ncbi:hypothetical protein BV133_2301 [Blastochloris viridis]|uniref:Uncharacterized protein n=1 Tax=Blastochloris viridis TaxID=1079 RepID=A0A182D3A0_BLAVI|nr:hypothetical protein BV133_2301 [Blastochloris viridis]
MAGGIGAKRRGSHRRSFPAEPLKRRGKGTHLERKWKVGPLPSHRFAVLAGDDRSRLQFIYRDADEIPCADCLSAQGHKANSFGDAVYQRPLRLTFGRRRPSAHASRRLRSLPGIGRAYGATR